MNPQNWSTLNVSTIFLLAWFQPIWQKVFAEEVVKMMQYRLKELSSVKYFLPHGFVHRSCATEKVACYDVRIQVSVYSLVTLFLIGFHTSGYLTEHSSSDDYLTAPQIHITMGFFVLLKIVVIKTLIIIILLFFKAPNFFRSIYIECIL